MRGHQGGKNSALTNELANVLRQLKSGKTRSSNPRELEREEIAALEQRRDMLQAQMREAAKGRSIARINSHTSAAVDAAADRVIASQKPTNERIEAMASVIVGGEAPPRTEGQTAQQRLAQIRQLKSSLTTEAEELREERKNDRVKAAEDRENRMNTVQESRRSRAKKKNVAGSDANARDASPQTTGSDANAGDASPQITGSDASAGAASPQPAGESQTTSNPPSKCTAVLKSGKRRGEQCGAKLPCKRHKSSTPTLTKWHLQMPGHVPNLWDAIYARFAPPTDPSDQEPPRKKQRSVHIGAVITLRETGGRSVPEDFQGAALTVTDVDQEQNEIKFVADGKRNNWPMDGVEPVRAKPLAIDGALQSWLQTNSGAGGPKCGHLTKTGGFCSWTVPCKNHQKREEDAMMREDDRSRHAERGICDVTDRRGCICTNVKGECRAHAPEESRCKSMLEGDLAVRCWGYKRQASDYCSKHQEFPNLSLNAKRYGDDCLSKACMRDAFLERFYPDADKGNCPDILDEFLAYVKRMSGHDDLWQVQCSNTCGREVVAQVEMMVGLLMPVRGDATAHAASTNHILSGSQSQMRVKVTDAGFVIVSEVDGVQLPVALLSSQ